MTRDRKGYRELLRAMRDDFLSLTRVSDIDWSPVRGILDTSRIP